VKECAVAAQSDAAGQTQLVAYVASGGDLAADATTGTTAKIEFWPSVAEYFVYDDLLYYALTNDHRRNHSYKTAIQRCVRGKTVVDIGTGADAILAQFCIEAGASRVYAIELLPEAFRKAQSCIKRLGLQDRITVIQGDATQVELPEKVDVSVSELVGSIGSCEGAAWVLNETRRFLKPEATVIPASSLTKIAAVRLPDTLRERVSFTGTPAEYAERIFEQVGRRFDLRVCIKNFPRRNVISNAEIFEALHFNEVVPLQQERHIQLRMHEDGMLDGLLLWLNLCTADDEVIDILDGNYCWLPVYFPVFWPGVRVKAGDTLDVVCSVMSSDNGVNPDYAVKGHLVSGGKKTAFEYKSLHHGAPYLGSDFYRELLSPASRNKAVVPSASRLRQHLAERLLEHMIPERYVIVSELPRLSTGKLDRRALLTLDGAGVPQADYVPPRTETESTIALIWQEFLRVDQVGGCDNFFDLGGHSLLATQVINRLRDIYSPDLTLALMFEAPTVQEMARSIDELTKSGAAASAGASGASMLPVLSPAGR